MVKRITAFLISLILIIFCCLTVSAANSLPEEETGPVADHADLLTEKEEENLRAKLEEFSKEHEMDLAVITVTHMYGSDIDSFARRLYSQYGYADDGAVLVRFTDPDTGDREICIYAHGEAKDIFTDDYIDKTFDAMEADVKAENYAAAFDTFVDMAAEGTKHKINWTMFVVFILAGMAGGVVVIMIIISKNKSIVRKNTANLYARQGSMQVIGHSDVFVSSYVTKTARPKKENSPSSSGSRKM